MDQPELFPLIARVAEVLNPATAVWEAIEFSHIRKNDTFRLFDLDAQGQRHPVVTDVGQSEFVADADARYHSGFETHIVSVNDALVGSTQGAP